MNEHQERFMLERHGMDVVLKARQLGYTTVIQLDMLDDCLFTSNLSAGVIAHNLVDAKAFFRDKIKFAYDNLPEPFRKVRAAENDSAESLRFNNGSSIRVGRVIALGYAPAPSCQRIRQAVRQVSRPRRGSENRRVQHRRCGQNITVESTAEGGPASFTTW
jgi:hypothetical protein